jgi:hypothetical protein
MIHTLEELELCCDVVYPECGMCPYSEKCPKLLSPKKSKEAETCTAANGDTEGVR